MKGGNITFKAKSNAVYVSRDDFGAYFDGRLVKVHGIDGL